MKFAEVMGHLKEVLKGKDKKENLTTTKVIVYISLLAAMVGGFVPYILSMMGKDPVEDIGEAWITDIAAIILGYLLKSYFENKSEAQQEFQNKVNGFTKDPEGNGDDEDAVG